ncbi:MAG: GPW/gp25 family protein [Microcoleus sp.]
MTDNKHLSFPFRINSNGRSAQVQSLEAHVRDELIQLILTNPGERAFLPEFGGGVRRLVFENASETIAGVTKARITQAISRWLGHRVTLEDLQVAIDNSTLEVQIQYRIAGTKDSRIMKFQRNGEV